MQAIADAQKFLEGQPYVGKSLSIADFVKRMHQAMNNNNPEFDRIPESLDLISQYLLLYSMSGEPGDFDTYVDYDYRVADLVVYLKTDSTADFLSLLGRFNDFIESRLPSGVTVNVGGSIPNSAALAEVIVRNKLLNIAQVATVVFVVASLVFLICGCRRTSSCASIISSICKFWVNGLERNKAQHSQLLKLSDGGRYWC